MHLTVCVRVLQASRRRRQPRPGACEVGWPWWTQVKHWLYEHTRARAHTRARRYQVGFSGDVHELTWSNLAYQPYFSVRVQRQQ